MRSKLNKTGFIPVLFNLLRKLTLSIISYFLACLPSALAVEGFILNLERRFINVTTLYLLF